MFWMIYFSSHFIQSCNQANLFTKKTYFNNTFILFFEQICRYFLLKQIPLNVLKHLKVNKLGCCCIHLKARQTSSLKLFQTFLWRNTMKFSQKCNILTNNSLKHMRYFLRPEKSCISLWKLITFYPNEQIWPNKLIKLKLSNHDNTQFVWTQIGGIVLEKLMFLKV